MEYNAKELIAQGYRRISNAFCHLSRVDREDWKEYMAKKHSPWSTEEGLRWVELLVESESATDMYRRGYSKDVIIVPQEIYKQIPGSNWDDTGYVKINKEE